MAKNKYPIYVISKGRWEKRYTAKTMEAMKADYHIVIEPQEYKQYASVIDEKKILTLPFSNLGQGSIPARNWVWEHAINEGHIKHWILDDNIGGFCRFNRNVRIKVESGTIFISYRWRGKYNEDTDLCLRVLKDNWCTVLFNAFLINKAATMTMKGGNTDEVYIDGDNRFKFADSLRKQHPDVVKVTKKYGRWHHQVDYRKFKKNRLIKKPEIKAEKKINDYGMIYVDNYG